MKIISTIFYTIFIALVIGIAGLLLGTMLPIPGSLEMKIVKSGSMEPEIPTGSLVVVKPAEAYIKGDIITFGKDTKTDIPTTHRIIAINPDGSFVSKGDANEEADVNPVQRGEVIGKVIFSVPGAGYVLDFARTKLGFTLLIGIPAGLVILEELFTIMRETQKWYRGRRGKGGGASGGGSVNEEVLDLRSHLKRVYSRRFVMDEIKVAIYVAPRWYEGAWWKKQFGIGRDAYHASTSLTVGLVFFAMIFAGHGGGTVSYFSDIESSLANILRAGVWSTEEVPVEITPFAVMVEEGGEVLGETDEVPVEEETKPEEEVPTPLPEETTENEEPAVQEVPMETPGEASVLEEAPGEAPPEPPLAE